MNSPTNKRLLYIAYLVLAGVLIFCAYTIVSAIHIHNSTGILKISSNDHQATISVSKPDHQAQTIGVGFAKVHLAPGSYQVAVSDKGQLATTAIQIYKQRITSESLDPSQGSLLPSVTSISFTGVTDLVNAGITASQATKLELDLFQFKPAAKNIEVMSDSIAPGHAPDSPQFSIDFFLLIDGVKYRAVLTYSDLININLVLYDVPPGGNVVYSS